MWNYGKMNQNSSLRLKMRTTSYLSMTLIQNAPWVSWLISYLKNWLERFTIHAMHTSQNSYYHSTSMDNYNFKMNLWKMHCLVWQVCLVKYRKTLKSQQTKDLISLIFLTSSIRTNGKTLFSSVGSITYSHSGLNCCQNKSSMTILDR